MSTSYTNSDPFKDRRRWWVALLMLFPTGAGYIYVGRPWRFVVFTMVVLLSIAALYYGVWNWLNNPIVFQLLVAAIIIAAIGFTVDIVTIAVKQNSHDLRWPQRRIWYVTSLTIWATLAFVFGQL